MHFVLQTDTRSRNKVYSYYICMYLISRGGERMWLLTKEGKTLEESDHVWHVQRSEPAAGSHKISHCGAVTCENPSVAIIKPPKAGETKPGQSPPQSRQQEHHHWLICSQENLDHPCDEVCELWQRRKPLVVHENNGLNPMLRLQDRSFWDHPQGQNVREGQTIVSRSKQTLFYANKASTYQTPNYLITHYTHSARRVVYNCGLTESRRCARCPGGLSCETSLEFFLHSPHSNKHLYLGDKRRREKNRSTMRESESDNKHNKPANVQTFFFYS